MSRLRYVRHCLCNALYVYSRGRAVNNVGKTCGQTPCFVLAIKTFKLDEVVHLGTCVADENSITLATCTKSFQSLTYNYDLAIVLTIRPILIFSRQSRERIVYLFFS